MALIAPTQVVPSWVRSGPTPLVAAVVILVQATPQSRTVTFTSTPWAFSKGATRALKSSAGWGLLGMIQTSRVFWAKAREARTRRLESAFLIMGTSFRVHHPFSGWAEGLGPKGRRFLQALTSLTEALSTSRSSRRGRVGTSPARTARSARPRAMPMSWMGWRTVVSGGIW